jgi:hypothetical protein
MTRLQHQPSHDHLTTRAGAHSLRWLVLATTVFLITELTPSPRLAHAEGKLVVVAGGGDKTEGPATECRLDAPFGVDFDSSGRMYIVELSGQRMLRVDTAGRMEWLGGTGQKGFSGNDGPVKAARFNGMHSLAMLPSNDIVLADTWNNCLRLYSPESGKITGLAGVGGLEKADSGPAGPADTVRFSGLYCVALEPGGKSLVFVDLENKRVRRLDLATRTVSTVAGNGKGGKPADGDIAATSPLVDPRAAATAPSGEVYILERGGHALRVVDKEGRIRTVVGTGKAGLSGDGGPALEAQLNGPKHLWVDRDGTVLIADTENHAVRRYDPSAGVISAVAGTGKKGLGASGSAALECGLHQPHGVLVHRDGRLFITDTANNRVLVME